MLEGVVGRVCSIKIRRFLRRLREREREGEGEKEGGREEGGREGEGPGEVAMKEISRTRIVSVSSNSAATKMHVTLKIKRNNVNLTVCSGLFCNRNGAHDLKKKARQLLMVTKDSNDSEKSSMFALSF